MMIQIIGMIYRHHHHHPAAVGTRRLGGGACGTSTTTSTPVVIIAIIITIIIVYSGAVHGDEVYGLTAYIVYLYRYFMRCCLLLVRIFRM